MASGKNSIKSERVKSLTELAIEADKSYKRSDDGFNPLWYQRLEKEFAAELKDVLYDFYEGKFQNLRSVQDVYDLVQNLRPGKLRIGLATFRTWATEVKKRYEPRVSE